MDSWEEEIRRFMLEEEEEDDELFLILVPALQLAMYDEKEPEKWMYLFIYLHGKACLYIFSSDVVINLLYAHSVQLHLISWMHNHYILCLDK